MSAFTLVELLAVIVIIAILAAILIPVSAGIRQKSKDSRCMSNLRHYAVANQLYVADNNGNFPGTSWAKGGHYGHYDLAPYINDDLKEGSRITWLSCPEEGWIYGLNAFISKRKASSITKPTEQIFGMCCGQGWVDLDTIAGKNQHLKKTPKPHSGRVAVVRLDASASLERVSTLTYAEVRRDTPSYQDGDETRYFLGGDSQYDQ